MLREVTTSGANFTARTHSILNVLIRGSSLMFTALFAAPIFVSAQALLLLALALALALLLPQRSVLMRRLPAVAIRTQIKKLKLL